MKANGRIPQLDGWRAISILLVFCAHMGSATGITPPVTWFRWQSLGGLGVRVFFVISGLLITNLLLAEKRSTGKVNLLRFYGRRTFRIMLPYYVFLGVIVLARTLHMVDFSGSDLLHALTYSTNYQGNRSWVVGHAWSLAVEEQFYLLWPLAMCFLSRRRAAQSALGVILLAPVLRSLFWKFVPAMHPILGVSFETISDSLAAGCLLACVREALWARPAYRELLRSRWMLLVPAVAIGVSLCDAFVSISYTVGYSLMNIGIALMVDRTLRFPAGRPARALSWSAFAWLGTISYSLYLWQQPFFEHFEPRYLPLHLAAAVAVGVLAHYAVEKPSLVLRRRAETWLRARLRRPETAAPPDVSVLLVEPLRAGT